MVERTSTIHNRDTDRFEKICIQNSCVQKHRQKKNERIMNKAQNRSDKNKILKTTTNK